MRGRAGLSLAEEYPVLDGNSDQRDILGALAEADQHVGAIQLAAVQQVISGIEPGWIGSPVENVLIEGVEKRLVGRVGAVECYKFRASNETIRQVVQSQHRIQEV